jgi:DNA-binding NtrC family response regulator
VINLHLPPLRERRSDIPLLIEHFVQQQNVRFGTQVKGFTQQAMEILCQHDWQGNVRELSNLVQAALAIDSSEYIDCETLAPFIDLPLAHALDDEAANHLDYATALACFEKSYLNHLFEETGGIVEDMAQQAGINVATIYRKMKKYGLR